MGNCGEVTIMCIYGQTHNPVKQPLPLYGVICRTGGQWSVKYSEQKTNTGIIENQTTTGYGEFPTEEYPGIPIIDLSGLSFDTCFGVLRLWERLGVHKGYCSIQDFLNEHRKLGIPVIGG